MKLRGPNLGFWAITMGLGLCIVGVLALDTGMLIAAGVTVGTPPPILSEFPLPAKPYAVAVESPTQIWATLPTANMIVRLDRQGAAPQLASYVLPTADSYPYGIAYAAGAIWVTGQNSNTLARLDIASGSWQEFSIPTDGSQPAGIAVFDDTPTRVWFTESAGNKLGLLTYTNTLEFSLTEYSIPWSGLQPEDLALTSSTTVWFTGPGGARIGRLEADWWPGNLAFASISTGASSRPWAMALDLSGYPWFTERTGNRIGRYWPTTFSTLRWHDLRTPASDPYDLVVAPDIVWFVERGRDRVAQLERATGSIREYPLPGSAPTGIDLDVIGCVWIAENGASMLGRWCPPYFERTYLPVLFRN